MGSQAVVYLNGGAAVTKRPTLTGLLRRLGSGRLARVLKPPAVTEDDPYLLILLAGQAFDEGREQQASCLVDAAYAAYDSRANVTHLKHLGHGPSLVPRHTVISLSTV